MMEIKTIIEILIYVFLLYVYIDYYNTIEEDANIDIYVCEAIEDELMTFAEDEIVYLSSKLNYEAYQAILANVFECYSVPMMYFTSIIEE